MKMTLDGILAFGTSYAQELLLVLIAVIVILCLYQLRKIGTRLGKMTDGVKHYLNVVLDSEAKSDESAAEVELTKEEKELLFTTDRTSQKKTNCERYKKDEELFNDVLREYL